MIISAKEIPNELNEELIKKEIFTTGIQELEFWKSAVKEDKRLFNLIFGYIFSADHRLAWRSCWIIDTTTAVFPDLLAEKLPDLINALLVTKDGSLKRHFTRMLCRYPIPDQYQTAIVDRCFELLLPSEPAAVRVNAMQLLFNIAQLFPDLKVELALVIENLVEEGGSAGFMNRAQKLLLQLGH